MGTTTASFSTFVRPPGSPIYSPSGPSLVLPKRVYSGNTPTVRSQRTPAQPTQPAYQTRDPFALEARRQLAQVLALIRAAEELEPPSPVQVVDAQNEELARSLQQLEAKLAERERAVQERELRLAEHERDQAEADVLLQHREALVAACKRMPVVRTKISEEERTALLNLKVELDRQEALLKENQEALRQREKFVEDSERRLFDKVQDQQEKETELEQREEEVRIREVSAGIGRGAGAGEAAGVNGADEGVTGAAGAGAKKVFDEFNE